MMKEKITHTYLGSINPPPSIRFLPWVDMYILGEYWVGFSQGVLGDRTFRILKRGFGKSFAQEISREIEK